MNVYNGCMCIFSLNKVTIVWWYQKLDGMIRSDISFFLFIIEWVLFICCWRANVDEGAHTSSHQSFCFYLSSFSCIFALILTRVAKEEENRLKLAGCKKCVLRFGKSNIVRLFYVHRNETLISTCLEIVIGIVLCLHRFVCLCECEFWRMVLEIRRRSSRK